ncbi:MAG TPA: dihydropteroate synthase [Thermoanaerobaculia bacterium]|nr:dihydropteroate synthase [Thermoanaerobaculia bacterium]
MAPPPVSSDLVIPAPDAASLREICAWDGFRPATFAAADFPVDVVRFEGSASRPVIVSRARRAETLKALPASLRQRADAAFARAAARPASLSIARGRSLDFSAGPAIMGIVNVTPDSFSDGGVHFDRVRAIEAALAMFESGAAIVDVGGESTRPRNYGEAVEVSAEQEIARVVPVIEGIRARTDAPVSVDTRKAAVARAALGAGADIVNDVTAGRYDPDLVSAIAAAGAGAILMHMRGTDPRTMQDDVRYDHPLADVAAVLAEAAGRAIQAGVAPGAIAVDPGFGFGKSPEGNLALLRHLAAFRTLGFPVAAGASRKGFVRRFSGVGEDAPPAERLPGSLAAMAAAASAGALVVRVHDVAESARYLRMARAIAQPAAEPAAPARVSVR